MSQIRIQRWQQFLVVWRVKGTKYFAQTCKAKLWELNIIYLVYDILKCKYQICNIYLEPDCPLFWWLNPSKQGLFQSKQGSFGFQAYIDICVQYEPMIGWQTRWVFVLPYERPWKSMLLLPEQTAMKQTTAKFPTSPTTQTVSYCQSDPKRDPSLPLTLFAFVS